MGWESVAVALGQTTRLTSISAVMPRFLTHFSLCRHSVVFTVWLFLGANAQPSESETNESSLRQTLQQLNQGAYETVGLTLQTIQVGNPDLPHDPRWQRIYARWAWETGQEKEAAHMWQILATDPQATPEDLAAWARYLLKAGRLNEAYEQIRQALDLHPDCLEFNFLLLEWAQLTGHRETEARQLDYFFTRNTSGQPTTVMDWIWIARALSREDPHGAWRLFQRASQSDPFCLPALLYGGLHCFEHYAWNFAQEELTKALTLNPHYPDALAALALVKLTTSQYAEAKNLAQQALAVHDRHPEALEVLARLSLVEENAHEARHLAQQALEMRPASLRLQALLAACHDALGQHKERDMLLENLRQQNPHTAIAWNTLAETRESRIQFAQAVAAARRAIETDPDDWHGYYQAGMNLLRLGEEGEGYRLLEQAYQLNRFNLWAVNTLNLLDKDRKQQAFLTRETKYFRLRIEAKEDPFLWPVLASKLDTTWEKWTQRFDFTPTGPQESQGKILIWIFAHHADFSVRTAGLPGLGALGATFGQVITLPSPRNSGRTIPEFFDWWRVLEHELLHVITLQKTGYRIPRWLTEAISVWVEDDPGVKMDLAIKQWMEEGRVPRLEEFNRSFIQLSDGLEISVHYALGGLFIRHFLKRFDWKALMEVLEGLGRGMGTAQAFEQATGTSLTDLDQSFRGFLMDFAQKIRWEPPPGPERAARLETLWSEKPDSMSLDELTALGRARFARGDWNGAAEIVLAGLSRDPHHIALLSLGGMTAWQRDRVRHTRKNPNSDWNSPPQPPAPTPAVITGPPKPEQQTAFLNQLESPVGLMTRVLELDSENVPALLILGLHADQQGEADRAISLWQQVLKIYPRFHGQDFNLTTRLAKKLHQQGNQAEAIAVLRRGLKQTPADHEAWMLLARYHLEADQAQQAFQSIEKAMQVYPFDPELHRIAARAATRLQIHQQAMRHWQLHRQLKPQDPEALAALASPTATP